MLGTQTAILLQLAQPPWCYALGGRCISWSYTLKELSQLRLLGGDACRTVPEDGLALGPCCSPLRWCLLLSIQYNSWPWMDILRTA